MLFFILFLSFCLRVIRKGLGKNSEIFVKLRRSLGQSMRERSGRWPLFLVFKSVPGCIEGIPGALWDVTGYYGMFQGCSGGVRGCSGGVPGSVYLPVSHPSKVAQRWNGSKITWFNQSLTLSVCIRIARTKHAKARKLWTEITETYCRKMHWLQVDHLLIPGRISETSTRYVI